MLASASSSVVAPPAKCGSCTWARLARVSQAVRGPACVSSKAWPEGPENNRLIWVANLQVRRSATLAKATEATGGQWSLKNPSYSLCWWMLEIVEFSSHAPNAVFDQCVFGAELPGLRPVNKPTQLLSSAP